MEILQLLPIKYAGFLRQTKTARIRCVKLKISKLWLPLQYIALSAHKSSDAIVLLNEVHREAKEWRKKENYGGKSSRMERDILKDEETTESKKHIGDERNSMEKTKLKINKTLEPVKVLK